MDEQICPARSVLSRIGERWTMSVCGHIDRGVTRFGDLSASLPGISAKVLSETLTRLERDGLIDRQVLDGRPPGVSYELTALGRGLLETVRPVVRWAAENSPRMEEARRSYDAGDSLRVTSRRASLRQA
ncbi:winged helix-turn-helix transcriptional regulator [Streptomyces sp. NPDC088923]|uniref:winged helix-turn-helix transcriptional regulator n=1 Tax=Streptomyces sp. NPDC088923 TaxID=3365913 RepID=UPI00382673D3